MKKNLKLILPAVVVVLAILLSGACFVTTQQNEYTIIRQFGAVVKIVDEPGLSMKLPFIQTSSTLPKTEMLYDLAVVPNVGVEWFADEHWSVAANVMYIWMKNDMRHRYWRLFSTDVEGRYWLTPQTCDVRTGHHFGLYAGFYRYDFEFGHRGWMGDANYGGGLSYGYAMRLFPKSKERFTLDMSLGFGYLGGTHKEYIPDDGCYVWQLTVRHHLFIPTKAELSLVWYPRWPFFNRKGTAQ